MARDAVATMGTILPADAKGRDAVHVAVIAVEAGYGCWTGHEVGVLLTENGYVASRNIEPSVGIVDPFLKDSPEEGQKFWLYLYPRSITGLSHIWTHPAFPADEAKPTAGVARSESWLREFHARVDLPNYDIFVAILKRIADGERRGSFGDGDGDHCSFSVEGDRFYFGGVDASGSIPPEFWAHASAVVGKEVKGTAEYFSCSC